MNQGHTDNLGDKAIAKVMEYYLTYDKKNTVILAPFIAYEDFSEIVCGGQVAKNKNQTNILNGNKNRSWKFQINRFWGRILPESIVDIIKEKKAISKFLDSYEHFDAVIIGGGELIKSHHPFTYAFLVWIAYIKKRFDCPIAIWGVSSDEKFSVFDQIIYKYVMKNCCYIGVRDLRTREIIKNLYHVEVEYSPDIVFEYNDIYPCEIENNNDVLFFLNAFEEVNSKYSTETNYFERFIEKIPYNCSRLKIGFATQSDYFEAVRFYKYLVNDLKYDEKIVILKKTFTVSEMVDVVAHCGTLISGRMHPMIIGLQLGKEVIPIAVKEKLKVFEEEWRNADIGESVRKQIENQIDKMLTTLEKNK